MAAAALARGRAAAAAAGAAAAQQQAARAEQHSSQDPIRIQGVFSFFIFRKVCLARSSYSS
jgi:hypothetical protein